MMVESPAVNAVRALLMVSGSGTCSYGGRRSNVTVPSSTSAPEVGLTDLEMAEARIREGITAIRPKEGPPNYVRAELALREAISFLRGAPEASSAVWAVAYDKLAWVCDAQGRDADAETFYLSSLSAQKAAGWPPVVCDELTMLRLAQLYRRQGRNDLGKAVLTRLRSQNQCSCRRSAEAFANDPGTSRVLALYG